MSEQATNIVVNLPKWLKADIKRGRVPPRLETLDNQMRLAILLSQRNVEEGTGGPFGTVIVETETGIIRGLGVNRVVPLRCPLLHGETVAIAMAAATVGNFNLGAEGAVAHTLVTSAQPCAMCCGAIVWSGVKTLVTGATGQDVESIAGFDEGPIHPDWVGQLRARGIDVLESFLRDEACGALKWYAAKGGVIYNGR